MACGTYTGGEESDGLVDPAERGDIDGLATDGTLGADTGGVLTGTSVDDGVNENLGGYGNVSLRILALLLAECADLDGVLVGEEVDDLERVRDDADGQELLAVVAALHHQACIVSDFRSLHFLRLCDKDTPVNQSLNDRHLRLLELLLSITAGGVGEVDGVADLDVVSEGDVLDLDTIVQQSDRLFSCFVLEETIYYHRTHL